MVKLKVNLSGNDEIDSRDIKTENTGELDDCFKIGLKH
jgi:hypothetical protein